MHPSTAAMTSAKASVPSPGKALAVGPEAATDGGSASASQAEVRALERSSTWSASSAPSGAKVAFSASWKATSATVTPRNVSVSASAA
jgi:hypothetical protein